jgi:2-iminobutanoate/2-iminopropanoate deaminase
MEKIIIKTEKAAPPIGPYNQGIVFNNILYTSGQIAIDGKGKSYIGEGLKKEIEIVFDNLSAILEEANSSFENVLKVSIFIKNMNDFSIVNDYYQKFFTESFPARETVEVARLPKDANIEISLVAYTL